ncbi:MAG: response regulator [Acetobacteraceae bacterium]|nr:response regulator [Acetobacteraceae bacterium]
MSHAEIIAILPYARRYARALTGSQQEGDLAVASAIGQHPTTAASRLSLYAAITKLAVPISDMDQTGMLQAIDRQLLLLTVLEDLSVADAAKVVGLSEAVAKERIRLARLVLKAASTTDVLIIEDEPLAAMDMRKLLEGCGHRIAGVVTTEADAINLALKKQIGLILADVNLREGGSGISAVRRIFETARVPVIFVSAFPEMLLQARSVEPVYVMSKPYDPMCLAVFAYQAINLGRLPLN